VTDTKQLPAVAKRKPPAAGRGRKKGEQNKLTKSVKEAFMYAAQAIGGPEALAEWAVENRTEFYKLYARLIPTEVTGPDGASVPVSLIIK
jgi:hypothetical protein